jgi:hypothetical protein
MNEKPIVEEREYGKDDIGRTAETAGFQEDGPEQAGCGG